MNNEQFTTLLEKVIIPKVQETRQSGGKEYARSEENIFANFERVSKKLGNNVEDVIMTYTLKHIDGIISHINGEVSQREDVRGRITDVIVYLSLLWGYLVKDEDLNIPEGAYLKKQEDTADNTPVPEFQKLGIFSEGEHVTNGQEAQDLIEEAKKKGAYIKEVNDEDLPKVRGKGPGVYEPDANSFQESWPANRTSCCGGNKRGVDKSNINLKKAKELKEV